MSLLFFRKTGYVVVVREKLTLGEELILMRSTLVDIL